MSRALLARIARLELRAGESGRTKVFHRLWARPDMDTQQQAAAMIAAGKAREGDDFMVRPAVHAELVIFKQADLSRLAAR